MYTIEYMKHVSKRLRHSPGEVRDPEGWVAWTDDAEAVMKASGGRFEHK